MYVVTVDLYCTQRLVARSQTADKSSRGPCWTEWAAAGVHSAVMLHNCLISMPALTPGLDMSGATYMEENSSCLAAKCTGCCALGSLGCCCSGPVG
jgi:hypothetical protein